VRVITSALLAVALLGVASPATAQIRREYWGVAADFSPTVKVPIYQKGAFEANQIDLSSSKVRVGFVRGAITSGYWGVSYMSRAFQDSGSFTRGRDSFRPSRLGVMGLEIYKFAPLATIKERVQLGLTFGIGGGWLRGALVRSTSSQPDTRVQPRQLLIIQGTPMPAIPTALLQITGAVRVTDSLRVLVGGGVDFPGQERFCLSAVYLFGVR
jgi:hypothetical protein